MVPKPARDECWEALLQLAELFGRPHVHSGIGIRKLGKILFECRGNREPRFLFLNLEETAWKFVFWETRMKFAKRLEALSIR